MSSFGIGIIMAEIATIRYVADDGEPPGVRGERSTWSGHHDPYNSGLGYLSEAAVGAANIEIQLIGGEFPDSQHSFEFSAGRGRKI